ncbi:uncharacterized protein BCR38DRAFT_120871 [Pseudomassariella vexata]|uniref:Uncharacterized protein n=1 Tax=Pseudomassariella vexata TaxID=1141098 RepID=A0A1Y2DA67_9PEZI|nr:uncharacterized protein BCR38DRAFT_120871 [Pseudomassariella vexata]ORY56149.1 hypothetical protein BCR38DRAFT_120871 [Pseudomassariella vexata]
MVWEWALPGDVPEVYMLKPYLVRPNVALPTVNTGFSATGHVCREAREIALKRTQMCGSQEAEAITQLELDILYIGALDFFTVFSRPEFFYGDLVQKLQHIAVDIVLISNHNQIPNTFRFLHSLKTLTVLFSEARGFDTAGEELHLSHPIR